MQLTEFEDGREDGAVLRSGVRVGADIASIPAVIESIDLFGSRYLDTIYTEREQQLCVDNCGRPDASRLAARFAAKEAVVKVLRPDGGIAYNQIEVVSGSDGAPSISCHGTAREYARSAGIEPTSSCLSLSHEGDYAFAVFVAAGLDSREDFDSNYRKIDNDN